MTTMQQEWVNPMNPMSPMSPMSAVRAATTLNGASMTTQGDRKQRSRLLQVLALALMSSVLAGCAGTFLPATGPSIGAIHDGASDANGEPQYRLVDLSAQTIGPYMRPKAPEAAPYVSSTQTPEVRLMPGDTMSIMIADTVAEGGTFAPLASGGTVFNNIRVNPKGQISLPYVGRPNVKGKTLYEVETIIQDSVRDVAVDPQVHVSLTSDLAGSILVAGAVRSPGRFSTLTGPLTLLDAINQAGGPVLEPHLTEVVVRTGKDSYSMNYEQVLNGRNRTVPPNAEIVLERARKRFVAMGAVASPGLLDLPSNNPSLLEVLGVAGGLKGSQSDASGVFVFRLNEAKKPGEEPSAEVFRLNMKDPAAMFLARQFLVQPEDAVYVTNAAVYEWQQIISPIVQVLILGRTVSNGF